MFNIDISRWVPHFIMADKNGYALAKAIEAGLQMANDIIADGVALMDDYDSMPEWRLDELAWEYNIPYDYSADIENKRRWISNAQTMYRLWGTPTGIEQYMDGYLNGARVEEAGEYIPFYAYHFRLLFDDDWSNQKIQWAKTAIDYVKNVRSALDSFVFCGQVERRLYVGCALCTYGDSLYNVAGVEMPDWYMDENNDVMLDEDWVVMVAEE